MYQIVDNLSHQAGRACAAGWASTSSTTTTPSPFRESIRGAYTFSSLANFLAGSYNNAGLHADVRRHGRRRRRTRTSASTGRTSGRSSPSLTLNAGLRYDLQFLETIDTDRNNVSPRVGFAWTPTASRRTVVRGSGGVFFDRVPLRALANALLSAGNTTDLNGLRQISISLSPTQAGAPVFPNILRAPVPLGDARQPHDDGSRTFRTRIRGRRSVEVEQQLGARSTVSAGYQYMRGLNLIISVNQNVPTCVAAGTNNGCRPNPAYANNSQYSSAADSTYHGMHVSFVQRPTKWGNYRVSYTLSKSMNNVGENFFSSPIDPFDLSKDWGRSDDDQRHRLVLNGSVNSSTDPARTGWETLTHGFQVSSMLQYVLGAAVQHHVRRDDGAGHRGPARS